MATLIDRALELPLKLKQSLNGQGKAESYIELEPEHRYKYVAKKVPLGDDRMEVTVRKVNLQRVVDSAQMARAKGPRVRRADDERNPEDIERAIKRAKKAVRHLCQLHKVDRMLTFGTRSTIAPEVFLARFQRFARAYSRETGKKFHYVAATEPHEADPNHLHAHVGVSGWFDLKAGLRIWHALCAQDDPAHEVNGSINVKTFRVRTPTEDIVSIIAGYIAKYVGKSLSEAFGKKSYWATRVEERDETQFEVLEAATPQQALEEVCSMLGVPARCVLLTHEGCFYPLVDHHGFWLKVTPEMPREYPF